jgi:hypothetical protein
MRMSEKRWFQLALSGMCLNRALTEYFTDEESAKFIVYLKANAPRIAKQVRSELLFGRPRKN